MRKGGRVERRKDVALCNIPSFQYSIIPWMLFCLLLLSSCSSYLSIEKRKYREGFHIEQNLFGKEQPGLTQRAQWAHGASQRNADPAIQAGPEILSVDNNGKEDIFFEQTSSGSGPIVFHTDTIKKKKKKHEGPKKFDEEKDISNKKRKVPAIVQIGLILGVISFATIFWSLLGGLAAGVFILGLVSSILGIGFSLAGLQNIKKNETKDGKGLAVAGLILSSLYFVALFFLLWWLVLEFIRP